MKDVRDVNQDRIQVRLLEQEQDHSSVMFKMEVIQDEIHVYE